jgi:hypothetical protein
MALQQWLQHPKCLSVPFVAGLCRRFVREDGVA